MNKKRREKSVIFITKHVFMYFNMLTALEKKFINFFVKNCSQGKIVFQSLIFFLSPYIL